MIVDAGGAVNSTTEEIKKANVYCSLVLSHYRTTTHVKVMPSIGTNVLPIARIRFRRVMVEGDLIKERRTYVQDSKPMERYSGCSLSSCLSDLRVWLRIGSIDDPEWPEGTPPFSSYFRMSWLTFVSFVGLSGYQETVGLILIHEEIGSIHWRLYHGSSSGLRVSHGKGRLCGLII
jgi:hypothetical protein